MLLIQNNVFTNPINGRSDEKGMTTSVPQSCSEHGS